MVNVEHEQEYNDALKGWEESFGYLQHIRARANRAANGAVYYLTGLDDVLLEKARAASIRLGIARVRYFGTNVTYTSLSDQTG